MRIFVCSHKKVNTPLSSGYEMIECGGANYYCGDNTGINISDRNWCYSELTAHYWIRHNVKCDIVGTATYHRWLGIKDDMISKNEVKQILNDFDLIVPKKEFNNMTIKEQFEMWHVPDDLKRSIEIMVELYPEYVKSKKYIETKGLYRCNLMICTKELFNKYIDWISGILDVLYRERSYLYTHYKHYRVCGYIAERLFNIWIYHNELKTFEINIIERGYNEFD